MKTPKRWIKCRQHTESWQPFKMVGQVPAGTGDCRVRDPEIPCLFRRSTNSHKIRKGGTKAAVEVDHNCQC